MSLSAGLTLGQFDLVWSYISFLVYGSVSRSSFIDTNLIPRPGIPNPGSSSRIPLVSSSKNFNTNTLPRAEHRTDPIVYKC